VIVAGANMLLGQEELQRARSAIVNAKVLVCQLEIDPDASLQALRMAKENHGQTHIFASYLNVLDCLIPVKSNFVMHFLSKDLY